MAAASWIRSVLAQKRGIVYPAATQALDLRMCDLHTLEGLGQVCPSLMYCDASANDLHDARGLDELLLLRRVDLSFNARLADVAALAVGRSVLVCLDLRGTAVSWRALTALAPLHILELYVGGPAENTTLWSTLPDIRGAGQDEAYGRADPLRCAVAAELPRVASLNGFVISEAERTHQGPSRIVRAGDPQHVELSKQLQAVDTAILAAEARRFVQLAPPMAIETLTMATTGGAASTEHPVHGAFANALDEFWLALPAAGVDTRRVLAALTGGPAAGTARDGHVSRALAVEHTCDAARLARLGWSYGATTGRLQRAARLGRHAHHRAKRSAAPALGPVHQRVAARPSWATHLTCIDPASACLGGLDAVRSASLIALMAGSVEACVAAGPTLESAVLAACRAISDHPDYHHHSATAVVDTDDDRAAGSHASWIVQILVAQIARAVVRAPPFLIAGVASGAVLAVRDLGERCGARHGDVLATIRAVPHAVLALVQGASTTTLLRLMEPSSNGTIMSGLHTLLTVAPPASHAASVLGIMCVLTILARAAQMAGVASADPRTAAAATLAAAPIARWSWGSMHASLQTVWRAVPTHPGSRVLAGSDIDDDATCPSSTRADVDRLLAAAAPADIRARHVGQAAARAAGVDGGRSSAPAIQSGILAGPGEPWRWPVESTTSSHHWLRDSAATSSDSTRPIITQSRTLNREPWSPLRTVTSTTGLLEAPAAPARLSSSAAARVASAIRSHAPAGSAEWAGLVLRPDDPIEEGVQRVWSVVRCSQAPPAADKRDPGADSPRVGDTVLVSVLVPTIAPTTNQWLVTRLRACACTVEEADQDTGWLRLTSPRPTMSTDLRSVSPGRAVRTDATWNFGGLAADNSQASPITRRLRLAKEAVQTTLNKSLRDPSRSTSPEKSEASYDGILQHAPFLGAAWVSPSSLVANAAPGALERVWMHASSLTPATVMVGALLARAASLASLGIPDEDRAVLMPMSVIIPDADEPPAGAAASRTVMLHSRARSSHTRAGVDVAAEQLVEPVPLAVVQRVRAEFQRVARESSTPEHSVSVTDLSQSVKDATESGIAVSPRSATVQRPPLTESADHGVPSVVSGFTRNKTMAPHFVMAPPYLVIASNLVAAEAGHLRDTTGWCELTETPFVFSHSDGLDAVERASQGVQTVGEARRALLSAAKPVDQPEAEAMIAETGTDPFALTSVGLEYDPSPRDADDKEAAPTSRLAHGLAQVNAAVAMASASIRTVSPPPRAGSASGSWFAAGTGSPIIVSNGSPFSSGTKRSVRSTVHQSRSPTASSAVFIDVETARAMTALPTIPKPRQQTAHRETSSQRAERVHLEALSALDAYISALHGEPRSMPPLPSNHEPEPRPRASKRQEPPAVETHPVASIVSSETASLLPPVMPDNSGRRWIAPLAAPSSPPPRPGSPATSRARARSPGPRIVLVGTDQRVTHDPRDDGSGPFGGGVRGQRANTNAAHVTSPSRAMPDEEDARQLMEHESVTILAGQPIWPGTLQHVRAVTSSAAAGMRIQPLARDPINQGPIPRAQPSTTLRSPIRRQELPLLMTSARSPRTSPRGAAAHLPPTPAPVSPSGLAPWAHASRLSTDSV